MADPRPREDTSTPALRREVIIPKGNDGLAFHRRVAVLAILVALMAGSLDAMLWREAQRRSQQAHIEAVIAAERAALVVDYEARREAGEVPDVGYFRCGNEP